MAYKWSDDLLVGVTSIDSQHINLFDRINKLVGAIDSGKTNGEVGSMINFLENYVVMHFDMEQKLMDEKHYPEFPSHKGEHVKFIDAFKKLKEDYEKNGSSEDLAQEVKKQVGDWLVNHIHKVDKKFGEFCKVDKEGNA